jgi:hypothetical protein
MHKAAYTCQVGAAPQKISGQVDVFSATFTKLNQDIKYADIQ